MEILSTFICCYCYYLDSIKNEFPVSFSLIYVMVLYTNTWLVQNALPVNCSNFVHDILRARCLYTYSVQKRLLLILNVERTTCK